MVDMDKAVSRILKAIRHKEKITLFGDYDVDGTTATAILLLFLKGLGCSVDFYIPHRLLEGYGLNIKALEKIYDGGTTLLITVDCGISNLEEARWAKAKGLDLIVSDHHEIPENLPPAHAILNPKQKNCPYPFKELAGVGVAFNLMIALRSALRKEGFFQKGSTPNLKEYLDLVALGTISDVVPLIGVNRILAKFGIAQLSQSIRPGILALKEVANMGEKANTTGINFRLAPRINAAGRLGDSREVVHLFTTENADEARQIAVNLNNLNSLRQRIEEKILSEAREMVASSEMNRMKNSLVLASQDWHPGVIGIVASRLAEEYHRPTILIALNENMGKGSGRSMDSFPLFQGIKACQSWVEKFGGHEQAAGLVIRPECISGFSQAFDEVVQQEFSAKDFFPRLSIDALAPLDQVDDSFLSDLEFLAPFGTGNPEPVLGLKDLTVLNSKLVGNGHLRLRIKEGFLTREAIGFRMGSLHPLAGKRVKLAFSPQVDFFQGMRNLQLKIIDLQFYEPSG